MGRTGRRTARRQRAETVVACAVLLVAAGAWWGVVGRDLWFVYDEWAYWAQRVPALEDGRVQTFFLSPYNDHLNAALFSVWWVVDRAVGVDRYEPYQGLAIAGHLAYAAAFGVLLHRLRAPRAVVMGGVAATAFLGVAVGNAVLGWQLAWTIPTALGCAALAAVVGERVGFRVVVGAVLLLLGGIAFGPPALPWAAAVVVHLALRRRLLPAGAVAAGVLGPYLVWRVVAVDGNRVPSPGLGDWADYFVRGMALSFGGWFGTGLVVGVVVAAVAVVGVVVVARSRSLSGVSGVWPVVAASVVGTAAWWASLAWSRATLVASNPGAFAPEAARYVHVGVALLAPALAVVVAALWSRRGVRAAGAVILVAVVGLGLRFGTTWVEPYRDGSRALRAVVAERACGSGAQAPLPPEAMWLTYDVVDELVRSGRLTCP